MGARSQRHLSEIYGGDSDGEVDGVAEHAHAQIQVASGTRTVPAKIVLTGEWDVDDRITVYVDTDQQADAGFFVDANGNLTPTQMASLLGPVIDGGQISAIATVNVVNILAVAPANTVTVSKLHLVHT